MDNSMLSKVERLYLPHLRQRFEAQVNLLLMLQGESSNLVYSAAGTTDEDTKTSRMAITEEHLEEVIAICAAELDAVLPPAQRALFRCYSRLEFYKSQFSNLTSPSRMDLHTLIGDTALRLKAVHNRLPDRKRQFVEDLRPENFTSYAAYLDSLRGP
jgi:hypothetical protein